MYLQVENTWERETWDTTVGESVDTLVFQLVIDKATLTDILTRFDPTSGNSPSVGDSRPTMRAVLNAAAAVLTPPVS